MPDKIERIELANLPTPIRKLERISQDLGRNVWIKRDDLTGVETSGNKIRKLEYVAARALKEKADVLITAGGIQSNHARATAAVAARLGLGCHLVLSISEQPKLEGNYLLDRMFGAKITFLDENDENASLSETMAAAARSYEAQGLRPYLIPVGASDAIGNLGYINAMKEIHEQESSLGICFDAVVCAVGSGGTYSGLFIGNEIFRLHKKIIGITVSDNRDYFTKKCAEIIKGTLACLDEPEISDDYCFIDGYKGKGYAISSSDELVFISEVAQKEGIILDPVYTGKAFYGLYQEIRKGHLDDCENILFIHTGGLYGLFPKQEQIAESCRELFTEE